MIRLFVTVEDVSAVIAAGYTLIRVYTDTAEDGTFVTLDGTITLVAGQESYEYTDLDGAESTWYKTAYYGVVPGEGDQSSARRGETAAAYATVKELRAETQIDRTTLDWELSLILDAAKQAIDNYCNRPDGFAAWPTASIRYYSGSGTTWQAIHEAAAVTAVAVKDSATDDEDEYTAWTLGTVGSTTEADVFPATGDPAMPEYSRTPYTLLITAPNGDYSIFTSGAFSHRRGFRPHITGTKGIPTVKVTARWGYSDDPPHAIKQACLMQASRWHQRLKSGMADTIAGPEFGKLMFRKALDPDIQMLLTMGRYVVPTLGRRY